MARGIDDVKSEGWLNPPFGCRDMPDPLLAASQELQFQAALRESVRQLALNQSLKQHKVFCFIGAPLGGRAIAFAR